MADVRFTDIPQPTVSSPYSGLSVYRTAHPPKPSVLYKFYLRRQKPEVSGWQGRVWSADSQVLSRVSFMLPLRKPRRSRVT